MDKIRKSLVILIGILFLFSCSKSDDNESRNDYPSNEEGKITTVSYDYPSSSGTYYIQLSDLKIEAVKTCTWDKQNWIHISSNDTSIIIDLEDNLSTDKRTCEVFVTAVSGDIIKLAISQEGMSGDNQSGIEYVHKMKSSQPAF